jgi:Protein of unknown function (DUF2752)
VSGHAVPDDAVPDDRAGATAFPPGPPRPSLRRPVSRTPRRALPRLLRHPAASPSACLVAGIAAACLLYRTDPHQPGHWLPRCPFNWATGLLCPLCGATRLAYDLLHGDPVRAAHENALLLLAVPFALWAFAQRLAEGVRGRRRRTVLGARAQQAVLGAAVVWTVVRNLR